MYLKNIINSNTGKIIMSIILGLGLATFFRSYCNEKKCYIFLSKKPENVENKIFKEDNKCYSYNLKSTSCNSKKKRCVLQYKKLL